MNYEAIRNSIHIEYQEYLDQIKLTWNPFSNNCCRQRKLTVVICEQLLNTSAKLVYCYSRLPNKHQTRLKMSQKSKISVLELKSRLKDLKYPTSGNKDTLIERLGWANMPQSFDIFEDFSTNSETNSPKFSKATSVIKRIPKGSRIQVCKLLTKILEDILSKNDSESWEKLLSFPNICLSTTNRGGKNKKSLRTTGYIFLGPAFFLRPG